MAKNIEFRGINVIKKLELAKHTLEDVINVLQEFNWDVNKISCTYREDVFCYEINHLIDVLKISNQIERIELIKKRTIEREGINDNFICLYLIFKSYTKDNSKNIINAFSEYINKHNKNDLYTEVELGCIINIGVSMGKYLQVIDDNGIVDQKFFYNWTYDNTNIYIKEIVKKYEDKELLLKHNILFNKIRNEEVDYHKEISNKVIMTSGRPRTVYQVTPKSIEEISLKYLKIKLDLEFNIRYSNRADITRQIFQIVEHINDLGNYTIYRFDFSNFFESVETNHVLVKYINKSNLLRFEKNLLNKLSNICDKCYAGIPTSNALIELISRDFDNEIEKIFNEFGCIFYSRYVDDGILIFNKFIKENIIEDNINNCIKKCFGDCIIVLNTTKKKFLTKYDGDNSFHYLGYSFTKVNHGNKKLFQYGINDEKITKYKLRINEYIDDYNTNKNEELFRQRIRFTFSRVVFYNNFNSRVTKRGDWDVIGISANYNLLRDYMNSRVYSLKINKETRDFINSYFISEVGKILKGSNFPKFLKSDGSKHYHLGNYIKKNKSIVFHPYIGWKSDYLVKQINKLDSTIATKNYSYRKLVQKYCELLDL